MSFLNSKSGTAVFYAAQNDRLSVVELLVEAKADVSSRGPNGKTAIDVAAENQRVVKFLQEKFEDDEDTKDAIFHDNRARTQRTRVSSGHSSSSMARFGVHAVIFGAGFLMATMFAKNQRGGRK
ncbi:hypothetical protein AAMO2058_000423100 [Amorphochlora amoebiformis]